LRRHSFKQGNRLALGRRVCITPSQSSLRSASLLNAVEAAFRFVSGRVVALLALARPVSALGALAIVSAMADQALGLLVPVKPAAKVVLSLRVNGQAVSAEADMR
jgi:hypothetical protein